MTPIIGDESDYTQFLPNPLSDEANPELITVQVVNPNPTFQEYTSGLADQLKHKRMKGIKKNCCPKGSKLKEHLVVEE